MSLHLIFSISCKILISLQLLLLVLSDVPLIIVFPELATYFQIHTGKSWLGVCCNISEVSILRINCD